MLFNTVMASLRNFSINVPHLLYDNSSQLYCNIESMPPHSLESFVHLETNYLCKQLDVRIIFQLILQLLYISILSQMIPHSNDYCNDQPFYSLCMLRHAMQMNEKQQKGRGKYHACCTTYILETRGAFLVCKNNNFPRALDWTSHGIDKNFIELTTIFTRDLPSTFLYFPVAPAI